MLHRSSRRPTSIAFGAIAIGICCALIWWIFFSPRDYAWVGRVASEASFGGTSDRVAGYLHPEEVKALGLTTEKAAVIINEVLKPRMKEFSVVGSKGQPIKQGSRISILFVAKGPGGTFDSGMEVVETSTGPKTFLSLVALQSLRGIQKSGELSHDKTWPAKWNALADDLTEHGLKGYYDLQSGKVYDWPKM